MKSTTELRTARIFYREGTSVRWVQVTRGPLVMFFVDQRWANERPAEACAALDQAIKQWRRLGYIVEWGLRERRDMRRLVKNKRWPRKLTDKDERQRDQWLKDQPSFAPPGGPLPEIEIQGV